MKLKDQHFLITGGRRGIGNFLTTNLAKVAGSVTILDLDCNTFDQGNKHNIICYSCDLSKREEVDQVMPKLLEENPKISILINNAGLIYSAPLINILSRDERKHSYLEWDRIIRINLYSVFNVSSHLADHFLQKRIKGLIINVSSISAKGNVGQTAYAAAKAGVNGLTLTWGKELAPFGIRVAGIAPGFFDTESTHQALKSSVVDHITKSVPLKRLGKLEEILNAVKFIIENDYYNGRILELDGGLNLN